MKGENNFNRKSTNKVKDSIQVQEPKSKTLEMQKKLIDSEKSLKNFSLYNFLYGSDLYKEIDSKNNFSTIFNNRRAENLIDSNLVTQNILSDCIRKNEETQEKLMDDLNKIFPVYIQKSTHAEIDLMSYNLEINKKRFEAQIKSLAIYYDIQISVIKSKCNFLIIGLEKSFATLIGITKLYKERFQMALNDLESSLSSHKYFLEEVYKNKENNSLNFCIRDFNIKNVVKFLIKEYLTQNKEKEMLQKEMNAEKQKLTYKTKSILEKYNQFILEIFSKNKICSQVSFRQLSDLITKESSINLSYLFENIEFNDNIAKEKKDLFEYEEHLKFFSKLNNCEHNTQQIIKESQNFTLNYCGLLNFKLKKKKANITHVSKDFKLSEEAIKNIQSGLINFRLISSLIPNNILTNCDNIEALVDSMNEYITKSSLNTNRFLQYFNVKDQKKLKKPIMLINKNEFLNSLSNIEKIAERASLINS